MTMEVREHGQSRAGNSACYMDTGWPSTYNFVRDGLVSLIANADNKQDKKLRAMIQKSLGNLEAKIHDYA